MEHIPAVDESELQPQDLDELPHAATPDVLAKSLGFGSGEFELVDGQLVLAPLGELPKGAPGGPRYQIVGLSRENDPETGESYRVVTLLPTTTYKRMAAQAEAKIESPNSDRKIKLPADDEWITVRLADLLMSQSDDVLTQVASSETAQDLTLPSYRSNEGSDEVAEAKASDEDQYEAAQAGSSDSNESEDASEVNDSDVDAALDKLEVATKGWYRPDAGEEFAAAIKWLKSAGLLTKAQMKDLANAKGPRIVDVAASILNDPDLNTDNLKSILLNQISGVKPRDEVTNILLKRGELSFLLDHIDSLGAEMRYFVGQELVNRGQVELSRRYAAKTGFYVAR